MIGEFDGIMFMLPLLLFMLLRGSAPNWGTWPMAKLGCGCCCGDCLAELPGEKPWENLVVVI